MHGKKSNQKLKPHLVLQYLLRSFDEINTAMRMVDQDMYLDEAEIENEKYDNEELPFRAFIMPSGKRSLYI